MRRRFHNRMHASYLYHLLDKHNGGKNKTKGRISGCFKFVCLVFFLFGKSIVMAVIRTRGDKHMCLIHRELSVGFVQTRSKGVLASRP